MQDRKSSEEKLTGNDEVKGDHINLMARTMTAYNLAAS